MNATKKFSATTRDILARARYIRDHDAAAARRFPAAAAIVRRVQSRIAARYERERASR